MFMLVMCNTYRIYQYIIDIDIFIQYRDTILAFGCINGYQYLKALL